ncbi:MAG: efflux RND transporter periplasmic adaptor subunit [Pirellulales bacterium]
MNIILKSIAVLISLTIAIESSFAQAPIEVESTLLKIIEIVQVPAQESGILELVNVREGTVVKAGDVLAKIGSKEIELTLKKAISEYLISKREAENDISVRYLMKSTEVAETELKRSEDSNAEVENSIPAIEIDRLKLVVEEKRLEMEQALEKRAIAKLTAQLKEADLNIVEEKLRKHQITSPLDGMVVQLFQRKGEWIQQSSPVVEIVRIDRLRAEGFIQNKDALLIQENNRVTVRVSIEGPDFIEVEGHIVFVDPVVDPVNRQVRVWAEIENVGRKLRPGFRATMQIHRE